MLRWLGRFRRAPKVEVTYADDVFEALDVFRDEDGDFVAIPRPERIDCGVPVAGLVVYWGTGTVIIPCAGLDALPWAAGLDDETGSV